MINLMSFFQALFIPFCLYINDIEVMAVVYSILLIVDISLNYKRHNKISYLDVWNIGFIFMASSEMILSIEILRIQSYGLTAVRYILLANVMFNMGFQISSLILKEKRRLKIYKKQTEIKRVDGKKVMRLLLVLSTIYFGTHISYSLYVFEVGRNAVFEDTVEGDINIIGLILRGISYFAPIAAAFFFRYYLNYKYKIYLALVIILCAVPQIFIGTRYLLLFTLVSPMIVLFDRRKLSPSVIVSGLAILFLIISLTSFIRGMRYTAATTVVETEKQDLIKQIALLGSNEGMVRRAEQLFRYVSIYGLHYGKESAFIFYFWVPRSIWPGKPTKIGHWLVNMYEPVTRIFSAAYGFWGQIFIDFGYYFSLVVLFIFGGGLRKLDMKKDLHLRNRSKISIVYIALFPVVFFSIRSPQTAIINFILVALIFIIINCFLGFIEKFNATISTSNSI